MSNYTSENPLSFADLVHSLCEEAKIDFLSTWSIALEVGYITGVSDHNSIMKASIDVIKALMSHNIFPGDYTLESLRREGFSFWPGTPDELIRRIEGAWTALDRMPDVDDICWFALKPSGKA